jgi:hypothetical protein
MGSSSKGRCNTLTINSVTALMTSHNIMNPNTKTLQHPDHKLCHRTDDVAQHRESQGSQQNSIPKMSTDPETSYKDYFQFERMHGLFQV